MALANVTINDTFFTWGTRISQLVNISNLLTEGQLNTSGIIKMTNPSGGVTLNVANGYIWGNGGYISNLRSEYLSTNSISFISNSSTLGISQTNSGRLGSTIYFDIAPLSISVSDTSNSNIATANTVNTTHGIAVAAFAKANTAMSNTGGEIVDGSLMFQNSTLGSGGAPTRTLMNPKGGLDYTAASVTGAIAIKLPVLGTADMIETEIQFRSHMANQNKNFTLFCGGYNHSSGWTRTYAYVVGNPETDNNLTVRFGNDGNNDYIIVGNTDTTWEYTGVYVKNISSSYSNGLSESEWQTTGVVISYDITDFSPYTINSVITNTQVFLDAPNDNAQYLRKNNEWVSVESGISMNSGNIILDADGDTGIGVITDDRIEFFMNGYSPSSITDFELYHSNRFLVGYNSGTYSSDMFRMNSAAGQNRDIGWMSGGSQRWKIRINNAAESGSNAGSDLQILTYDDAGNYKDVPLRITRANSDITFYGNTAISGKRLHFDVDKDTYLESLGDDYWLVKAGNQTVSEHGFSGSAYHFFYGAMNLYTTKWPSSVLTISSGAITPARSHHSVSTEGAAATDDLITINNPTAGMFLFLRPQSGSQTVVIKEGGNIFLQEGQPIVLSEYRDMAVLWSDGSYWYEMSRPAGWTSRTVVTLMPFDSTETVTVGDGAGGIFFRVPSTLNGKSIVGVSAAVGTAGTTGTTDIQIRNITQSQDVLSTKITIDSGETDSSTAASAAVINTSNADLTTGDQIRIDVDAVSTTAPQGLVVEIQIGNS